MPVDVGRCRQVTTDGCAGSHCVVRCMLFACRACHRYVRVHAPYTPTTQCRNGLLHDWAFMPD